MEYYIYKIKYNEVLRYYLWYSDEDNDKFLLKNGRLYEFSSLSQVRSYSEKNNLTVNNNGAYLEIKKTFEPLDCNYFLDTWNFVTDICNSLGIEFWGNNGDDDIEQIYSKIFRGNNLEALTPPRKHFIPYFDHKEKLTLKRLYDGFLEIFLDTIAS